MGTVTIDFRPAQLAQQAAKDAAVAAAKLQATKDAYLKAKAERAAAERLGGYKRASLLQAAYDANNPEPPQADKLKRKSLLAAA